MVDEPVFLLVMGVRWSCPVDFFRAGKALGAVFNQLVRSCAQPLLLE